MNMLRDWFFYQFPQAKKRYLQSTFLIRHRILPLLYPYRCPLCRRALPYGSLICPGCAGKLPYVEQPVCFRCGKPVHDPESEYCTDCRLIPKSFSSGRALFLYNEITRPMMAAFKYKNVRCLSTFLTGELFHAFLPFFLRCRIEAVIPVPIHKKKQKKRGYNQAELLAKELAFLLHLPCYSDFLVRAKETAAQKSLGPKERYRNLADAFSVHARYRELAKALSSVLLIDDIYTTGATAENCSRALLNAGVTRVHICSVCIGSDAAPSI